MQKLRINLFGLFEARVDDVPVRLPTRRVELILALLALSPDKAISRSYLAALLWPGQEDAQARASLRQALYRLRGALRADHAPALETAAGWVKLKRDAVVLDADALAEEGRSGAAVPNGIPLDGLSGFEPEIEELIDMARADLRRRLHAWHQAAAATADAERRYVDLEGHARSRLALEPYDEAALRDLMTALWRQGRRNAALAAFRQVSQRIRTDLSVTVETETTGLYRDIRATCEREPPEQGAASAIGFESDPLADDPATDAAAVEEPPAADVAHLRHLAVIHVVSERLRVALRDPDPESAEAGSQQAIRAIEVVVAREGGDIIGRAGHQLSAVFGARSPDESPALSAALAGFEIARQDCAVGINAGAGLVGTQSATFPLAHVAQSLAAVASPGEVRVASGVEAACRGAFVFSEADVSSGDPDLQDAPVWRLEGETSSRSGFDIRMARGLRRFSGRTSELSALADIAVQDGPRVAAIIGEAGIGKSRLAHEFIMRHEPATFLRVQFGRGESGGGIARFGDMVRPLLDMDPELPGRKLPEALTAKLAAPQIVERIQSALAGTLGDAVLERTWLQLPRTQRLQSLADALLTLTAALSGRDSVVLIEDTHWADDDASLLIERLIRSLDAAGPMLICTRRPGKSENWLGDGHVRNLVLRPLDRMDAAALLDGAGLSNDVRAAILDRGEGVPLFLEELLRAAVEPGVLEEAGATSEAPRQLTGIPIGLRGVLSYRIDALPGPARQMLEAAAVLGSGPTDDLLAGLSGLRHEAYELAISTLADADLLYRIRTFPQRSYAFKHALTQDAAYQGIPASRRAALHAGVVRIHDELRGASGLDDAVLARHALDGCLPDRAIDFAMRAAKDAAARSAYALANRMTDIALRAIEGSPPSQDMLRLEADILTWRRALLWPLAQKTRMMSGLARAEAIARELGDDQRLADVSIHRAYIHSDDGNPQIGLDFFEQAQAASIRAGDSRLTAESALAKCQILSLQGKMRGAREAIKDHVCAWDNRRHALDGLLVTRYVMLQFHLARINGALGDGKSAWAHIEHGAATAIETARPVDQHIACRAIAEVCAMVGDVQAAIRAFAKSHEIAAKAELPAYVAWSEAELAELELESDDPEAAAATLRRLLEFGDNGLLRIAQIKAKAALACAAQEHDTGSTARLREILKEAEAVDLPMVRVKLLRELSSRLQSKAPEEAADLMKAAASIVATEGYAAARLPMQARVANLIDAIGGRG